MARKMKTDNNDREKEEIVLTSCEVKPLFSEYTNDVEKVVVRRPQTKKRTRKDSDESDSEAENEEETEENGNEEEQESNPAWMRYMPSRRFLKVRRRDERTDLPTSIVTKNPVSSNPFSPTHPKNQIKNIKSTTKMISTNDEDQEKTRNKKLRYISSNPNEAAELISFFNISKSS
jgi:hypothetical protein